MKKTYDGKFKSRAAPEALRGDLTVAEFAGKYQVHPNPVRQWKKKLMEGASELFLTKAGRKAENKPCTEDDLMKRSVALRRRTTFYEECSRLAA